MNESVLRLHFFLSFICLFVYSLHRAIAAFREPKTDEAQEQMSKQTHNIHLCAIPVRQLRVTHFGALMAFIEQKKRKMQSRI